MCDIALTVNTQYYNIEYNLATAGQTTVFFLAPVCGVLRYVLKYPQPIDGYLHLDYDYP